MRDDDEYEFSDDLGSCSTCGEDTRSASVRICSNCELQDRIDNDDSMPHNFSVR